MLTFLEGELEVLPASESRLRCNECGHRLASWRAKKNDTEEVADYCGWCLMYGNSQWARDNRDEIRFFGEFVRKTALDSLGKNTHVPELDVMHRLNWRDAERAVMGIVFTSRTLRMSFDRIAHVRARVETLYGSGDEETGGGGAGDVPAAESGPAGEAENESGG